MAPVVDRVRQNLSSLPESSTGQCCLEPSIYNSGRRNQVSRGGHRALVLWSFEKVRVSAQRLPFALSVGLADGLKTSPCPLWAPPQSLDRAPLPSAAYGWVGTLAPSRTGCTSWLQRGWAGQRSSGHRCLKDEPLAKLPSMRAVCVLEKSRL